MGLVHFDYCSNIAFSCCKKAMRDALGKMFNLVTSSNVPLILFAMTCTIMSLSCKITLGRYALLPIPG